MEGCHSVQLLLLPGTDDEKAAIAWLNEQEAVRANLFALPVEMLLRASPTRLLIGGIAKGNFTCALGGRVMEDVPGKAHGSSLAVVLAAGRWREQGQYLDMSGMLSMYKL